MDGLTHVLTDIQYSTNVVISLSEYYTRDQLLLVSNSLITLSNLSSCPQLNMGFLKIKLWLPNLIIALSLLFVLLYQMLFTDTKCFILNFKDILQWKSQQHARNY